MEHKKQIDYGRNSAVEILQKTTNIDLIHFVYRFATRFLEPSELSVTILKNSPEAATYGQ